MIRDLDQKTRREVVEICLIQQEEFIALQKKNAELEISLNEVVEAVLDNRSKMVTIQTLDVIRAAIEKHGLTRKQAKQLKVKNNPTT